jgi:hypothetical protein
MNERARILVLSNKEIRITSSETTIMFSSHKASEEAVSQVTEVFFGVGATSVTTDPEFRDKLDIFGDFQGKDVLVWRVSWHHQQTDVRPILNEFKWNRN